LSITTWGFGSCANAISTGGWGGCHCLEYLPHIIAEYLGSKAYTCVLKRTYIEIQTRVRGDVLLRLRPDQIPERLRGAVLERARGEELVRSAGWPYQSGIICE
jgi:hypothetical protein